MTDQNQQSLLLGKIAAYTELLVKDSNSTIFVSLGETYRKMGLFDDARQIISKGLQLHPDFSPAYIVLARILCQLEDFDGSVLAFEQALDLDGDSLAALVGYARVQILLGQEGAARELLLRARDITPADPVINKLILSLPDDVELIHGQAKEEADHVEAPVVTSPALVSSTLADLYLAQGLPEKALELFKRLSAQNPDDITLRRRVRETESQLHEENHLAETVATLQNEPQEDNTNSDNTAQMTDFEKEQLMNAAADEGGEIVIATFDRWLANIRQRRGNV